MKTITVNFQASDFEMVDGVLNNYDTPRDCPLARAITRALGLKEGEDFVIVDASDNGDFFKQFFTATDRVAIFDESKREEALTQGGIYDDEAKSLYHFNGSQWGEQRANEIAESFQANPNYSFSLELTELPIPSKESRVNPVLN